MTVLAKRYDYNKRWRLQNPAKRYEDKKRYHERCRERIYGDPNKVVRRVWTSREINAIITENRPCDRAISESLGRTIQAVQVKRSKLKLAEN